MVDADCTFNPFPAAKMTCCTSGRDFKTCHFICNAMIRSEFGKGNLINHVTATSGQGEKGQNNLVNGITIAEEDGKGNMVGGVTIAEVGQGNMAGGNMVNGITVPGVGQGNLVSRMTASIGQGEKGQNNMVNGVTIAEEVGKGNMVNGVTIPSVNTRTSSSSPAVDGHEPVARVRVQSDYTLGRYKSILSGMCTVCRLK